ncbi:ubiquitinyl hydrolase 1 [Trifolium repens]|nr:ubiquitin carboxyl-terminal hydrolase [Trifolium repens]WJX59374.1 ubiquitinyl hydrolase 1 [Trifolium repens]
MAKTHLYTIKVARDEDLVEQIGKDVYFDLVDHEKVRSFRVRKDTSINVFKEDVAKEFGIPARFQRFWICRKRQNHSFRPWRTLTHIEEAQSLAELVLSKVMGSNKAEYHLFLQVERGLDLCPIAPLIMRKDDILLFFKLYDPEKEELRYVGRFFVNCTGKPIEILTKLKKLAGYDPDEEIELYEDMLFNIFKEEVAKEFGIPARFQHFWLWAKRQNHTFRPSRPLTHIEESGTVGQLIMITKAYKPVYHLFLQVEHGLDLCPIASLNMRKDDILLFFKLYDPEKEELRYVGRLFVNCTGKPSEIVTKLNNLAGYDLDEEIELYEFEPYVRCEPVEKKLTFQESELENGDIICFQKATAMDNVKLIRYPDVLSYLKYLSSRKVPFSSSYKESKDEESSEEQIKNIIDLKEIEAMIDEDVIGAIDRVLSEGVTIQSMRSIQDSRRSLKVQELRDIVFKEDLFGKFKNDLTPEVIFNAVKERIDVNAYAFSSRQLEQVSAIVNLLNNIVRMFKKLKNLKKEQDSGKKSIDQDNEVLKVKRQKILASNTSFLRNQTTQTADLKAKLAVFQAQTDLESHEKLYQFFRANPPF